MQKPHILLRVASDPHEFDFVLQEGGSRAEIDSLRNAAISSDDSTLEAALLSSTTTFPGAPPATTDYLDTSAGIEKLTRYQEQQQKASILNIGSRIKEMTLQDIAVTFVIPSIALFVAGRWSFNRILDRVQSSKEKTLDLFASEMVSVNGQANELEQCFKKYRRKLAWMGPARRDVMLKRYLALYAKSVAVSPKSISSLSFVLSIFELTEAKTGQLISSLCKQMGRSKIASIGKLYFLGTRIIQSPEGKAALDPVKAQIMNTYKGSGAEELLVETSQT